ncbi:MAG: hypothetical protein LC790_08515, partial [Actinobacteria bacterium]|nr:hypothetical protein [Actinomycetota bacterium]
MLRLRWRRDGWRRTGISADRDVDDARVLELYRDDVQLLAPAARQIELDLRTAERRQCEQPQTYQTQHDQQAAAQTTSASSAAARSCRDDLLTKTQNGAHFLMKALPRVRRRDPTTRDMQLPAVVAST